MSDLNGWQRLKCPFFTEVCRHVLCSYFRAEGFEESRLTSIGGVIFRRGDVFVEIGYEPETHPDYSPTVVLGYGAEAYGEAGSSNIVPMWFVLEDDAAGRRYSFWTFRSEDELRRVFGRMRDELLEPCAKPLWTDADRLKSHIETFRAGLPD